MLDKNEKICRYFEQYDKVIKMLRAENLYDYIDGLKYAYSLSMRYKSTSLLSLVQKAQYNGDKPVELTVKHTSNCLKAKILSPWNDTYWFDKTKAESLQQYILEHSNSISIDSQMHTKQMGE